MRIPRNPRSLSIRSFEESIRQIERSALPNRIETRVGVRIGFRTAPYWDSCAGEILKAAKTGKRSDIVEATRALEDTLRRENWGGIRPAPCERGAAVLAGGVVGQGRHATMKLLAC